MGSSMQANADGKTAEEKRAPKGEQTKIYGLQLHLPMSGEIIQSFFSLMFASLRQSREIGRPFCQRPRFSFFLLLSELRAKSAIANQLDLSLLRAFISNEFVYFVICVRSCAIDFISSIRRKNYFEIRLNVFASKSRHENMTVFHCHCYTVCSSRCYHLSTRTPLRVVPFAFHIFFLLLAATFNHIEHDLHGLLLSLKAQRFNFDQLHNEHLHA